MKFEMCNVAEQLRNPHRVLTHSFREFQKIVVSNRSQLLVGDVSAVGLIACNARLTGF